MAGKRKENMLIGFLRSVSKAPPEPAAMTNMQIDSDVSMSRSERDRIVRRITETINPRLRKIPPTAFTKYVRPLSQNIADLKLDNATIELLAPEVNTAKTIVIPSIISPTDLRDGNISIQSTSSLVDKDVNARISKLLETHFNDQLKLSRKLPDWIHEALYGAGAKPVMVLPTTELDAIMDDPSAIISQVRIKQANESLRPISVESLETISVLGIADAAHIKPVGRDAKDCTTAIENLAPALESHINAYRQAVEPDPKKLEDPYNLVKRLGADKSTLRPELHKFITGAVENLAITDNPDVMKLDSTRKAVKQADVTDRILTHYKVQTLLAVGTETKPSMGNPVVYELPPESVIPIFTPGAPTDHIGYFVAIDEYGNPLHLTSGHSVDRDLLDGRRTDPESLYKAFGFDNHFYGGVGGRKDHQKELMMRMYQSIIEAHVKGRMRASGFDNVYVGATENVYRYMFSRYLSQRKTRLLFVPRDLMTYFCFRHNADGTGRSKIEDIKFILSLKITLLICRMMAAMNSAINRRKVTVNFTEEMGDPIQYMQELSKEAIDKMLVNFTYDPTEISRTLAQRSLTVSAKGIPGAETFEVSSEPNESRDIRPDEGLLDDLNNMMILTLDVPPSAVNLLSEHEFSRSVATNNLFFSRRISAYQAIVCEKVARHVQVYTTMSEPLKKSIMALITAGTGSEEPPGENGTAHDSTTSNEKKLHDIIRNIITVLPAPDVAPNKSEFEELDSMIGSLSTALEAIYDNDLGSVDDNPIALVRALVKSDVVRSYMTKIGVARDVSIPDFGVQFVNRLIEFRQQLTNLSKGLKDVTSKTTATPAEGDTPPSDSPF